MKENVKLYSHQEMVDEIIGKKGTPERDLYDKEIEIELLGYEIKKIRKEKNMTQSDLGKLVGVKKAQISRLEASTTNVNIITLLKVFNALEMKLSLNISNL